MMNHYLWLDLETTGGINGIEGHDILEVAVAVTDTDPALTERIPVTSWLVDYRDDARALQVLVMPDVVMQMHDKSGLRSALSDADTPKLPLDEIEAEILAMTKPFRADGDLILAGSGIARFDRQFLRRDMPTLVEAMPCYEFDIGSLRVGLKNIKATELLPFDPERQLGKTHRAAQDVADHITSARHMLSGIHRGLHE